MYPKWSSIITRNELIKSTSRLENLYEVEIKRLEREINALRLEKEKVDKEFEEACHEPDAKKKNSVAVQTMIEAHRNDLSTNYLRIYQIYGTIDAVWQMLQDGLVKFEQFNSIMENYSLNIEKDFSSKNHMSIVIYFNIRTHTKRLTYTLRIERPQSERFEEMVKQRKRELQSLTNAEDFAVEMKSKTDLAKSRQEISYTILERYMLSQSENFMVNFFSTRKGFKKTIKDFLQSKTVVTRSYVWAQIIQNKLFITPELFCHFRGLCKVNFPENVKKLIELDLNRVLRFYQKYLEPDDMTIVKGTDGMQGISPEEVATMDPGCLPPQEFKYTRIFHDLSEILCCFQVYRGDIGYVQGMCRISYLIYIVFKNNIEAFTNFANLVFFKKPLLKFYRFNLDSIDRYTECLKHFLLKLYPDVTNAVLSTNENLLSVFVMESFYTLYASYFDEEDVL